MNVHDLRERTASLRIPPDAVSIDAGLKDEAYVLENRGNQWAVFYFERGVRTGEKTFESEEAACDYLFERLLRAFKIDPGADAAGA